MRARGLSTVKALIEQGEVYLDQETGEYFIYEPQDPEARRAFREDVTTLRAILKRASAFREALLVSGGDPFLKLPKYYGLPDVCSACGGPARRCRSCGVPVQGDPPLVRCQHCELAVRIVLGTSVGSERAAQAPARPRSSGEVGR